MVEIDDKPILRCIMKIYSSDGANDVMSWSGHTDYMGKEYFAIHFLDMSDTDSERVETVFDGSAVVPTKTPVRMCGTPKPEPCCTLSRDGLRGR